MIYAAVKGIHLHNGEFVFSVDRIDSSKATSGTVTYSFSLGELRHPKIIRIKLQKKIAEEVNLTYNKNYSLNDVIFVTFSNDFDLNEWQPQNVYVVEQYGSGNKIQSKSWYASYDEETEEYSGKLSDEVYTWVGVKLYSKESRYYDSDGTTILSSTTETYMESPDAKTKKFKREL